MRRNQNLPNFFFFFAQDFFLYFSFAFREITSFYYSILFSLPLLPKTRITGVCIVVMSMHFWCWKQMVQLLVEKMAPEKYSGILSTVSSMFSVTLLYCHCSQKILTYSKMWVSAVSHFRETVFILMFPNQLSAFDDF